MTLNWFEYKWEIGERMKLNDFFEFPFKLDLTKWCKNEFKEESEYELKGVVVH